MRDRATVQGGRYTRVSEGHCAGRRGDGGPERQALTQGEAQGGQRAAAGGGCSKMAPRLEYFDAVLLQCVSRSRAALPAQAT